MAAIQSSTGQTCQRSTLHTLPSRTQINNVPSAASSVRSSRADERFDTVTDKIKKPMTKVKSHPDQNLQIPSQQASSDDLNPSDSLTDQPGRESDNPRVRKSSSGSLPNPDLDPPVTRETLQALELPRIINDPKLRYDLCFDENIEFKPATNCPHGCEKYRKGQEYYQALRVELIALLSQRSDMFVGDRKISLLRVPRMFESIRETLEGLCPRAEWPAINEQLDTRLLMQQIHHGVLDFAKLGEWLCQLLIRSCAPLRDDFIKGIGSMLREASVTNSVDCLLNGIKRIFGALELMKLDVANHQIRSLQSVMVDDYIAFGRKFAITALANSDHDGVLIATANWFARYGYTGARLPEQSSLANLAAFTGAIVNIIIQRQTHIPLIFAFDCGRFTALKCDFHHMLYRTAVRSVFDSLLRGMAGWNAMDQGAYRRSLVDLLGLTDIPATRHKKESLAQAVRRLEIASDTTFHAFSREMSTAIVSKAYQLLQVGTAPCERVIDEIERSLIEWQEVGMSPMTVERLAVGRQLADAVGKEIQPLLSLSPTQIRSRMRALEDDVHGPVEHQTLARICREVAHVSILQWRIWGPLLYEPFSRIPTGEIGTLSSWLHHLDVSES